MVPARRLLRFLLMALALAVLGCASTPKPTIVKMDLDVAPGVNPDSRGRASPVVVRLFELKSLAAFNDSDFFSLFDRDKETLGAELVARDEMQLQPGEKRKVERVLQLDTHYLGVIAAFRDLEQARWRAAVPVPAGATVVLTVRLDARSVSLVAH
jgi:type VI secretion system protein VasD